MTGTAPPFNPREFLAGLAALRVPGDDRVHVMRRQGREFVALRLDAGTVLLDVQTTAADKATLIRQAIREAVAEALTASSANAAP